MCRLRCASIRRRMITLANVASYKVKKLFQRQVLKKTFLQLKCSLNSFSESKRSFAISIFFSDCRLFITTLKTLSVSR